MAEVYVDSALTTGLNDGTSWANAYQSLATCLNGTNAISGDNVWWKNGETTTASTTLIGGATIGHPVKVFGVKAATTNEPPQQSDLIPGWRTGDSRTEANLAYNDAGLPKFENTSGSTDIFFQKAFYIYAGHIKAGDSIGSSSTIGVCEEFEECLIESDQLTLGSTGSSGVSRIMKNCHRKQITNEKDFGNADTGLFAMRGGKYTNVAGANSGILGAKSKIGRWTGVDFSDAAHTLVNVNVNMGDGPFIFENCQLHASTALLSGTRSSSRFRLELYQCPLGLTGKTSGTIQNIDIATDAGDITEETTIVRTGGADDGGGVYSLAFTPAINGTRDQYYGLVGPWMAFKVSGDGTPRTVTVYIANSGAADYNDDDVYLEIVYPSEAGTARYDNQTTQMKLLGTPAAITDDTGSTWGTGGNNHQKLQATIAPDYVGRAYCRVVFAKNFGASPETLYVDPLPAVS